MIATFFLALVASFWGSVPPGPSNLAVMHTVLNKNTRAGLWMALGACLPELPYSLFALLAIQYVAAFQSVEFAFEILTAIVLFAMGIYATFFQARKKVDLEETTQVERFKIHPFWKGALIGSLNLMIFAFWVVTAGIASKSGLLHVHSTSHKIAFVFGASVGAFLLLCMVAVFNSKIKERLSPKITSYLNEAIGITFILLALIQAIKSYLHHF